MANALFELSVHSEESCRAAARKAGLELRQFDADIASPQILDALRQTAAWVKSSDAQGLPQLWINDVVVVGEPTEAGLQAARRRAESR